MVMLLVCCLFFRFAPVLGELCNIASVNGGNLDVASLTLLFLTPKMVELFL